MNGKFAKTEISLLWKLLIPNIYTSCSVINDFMFISSINVMPHLVFLMKNK